MGIDVGLIGNANGIGKRTAKGPVGGILAGGQFVRKAQDILLHDIKMAEHRIRRLFVHGIQAGDRAGPVDIPVDAGTVGAALGFAENGRMIRPQG